MPPRRQNSSTASYQPDLNATTTEYKFTIPKKAPIYLKPFIDYLRNRHGMTYDNNVIKKLIDDHWNEYHLLGKPRKKRDPKPAMSAEEPNELLTNLGDGDGLVQTTLDSLFAKESTKNIIKYEYPPIPIASWKKQPVNPLIRTHMNVEQIRNVFRKLDLDTRSGPYRALVEINQSMKRVLQSIPESNGIVQKEIENFEEHEKTVSCIENAEMISEQFIHQNDDVSHSETEPLPITLSDSESDH